MVTISQRGGESQSMELALSHYTAAEGHALANAEVKFSFFTFTMLCNIYFNYYLSYWYRCFSQVCWS